MFVHTKREQKKINSFLYKRPIMKTKQAKDEMIKIRVSSDEKKLLQYHATKLNISISDFVRSFVIIKN
jgi:uncharacterized protein (DUF1778 family)